MKFQRGPKAILEAQKPTVVGDVDWTGYYAASSQAEVNEWREDIMVTRARDILRRHEFPPLSEKDRERRQQQWRDIRDTIEGKNV